jgi:hypothetical protein
MRHRITATLAAALLLSAAAAPKAAPRGPSLEDAPKVILVTFDGVRWQDVFRGASPDLMADKAYANPDIVEGAIGPAYLIDGAKTPEERGAALMPFLHGAIARQGVLLGDRDHGQCAEVANDLWYSYPGYNEMLTGRADPAITDNGKTLNPNVSVLESLNRRSAYQNRVSAVGTWDVFAYILNTPRSHLPVNKDIVGFPTDVKTTRGAWEILARHDQRLIYIGFGDTDEFGHAGDYAAYLMALERGDEFLRELWTAVQSDPYYRGKTTLIVLTDHGRGETPKAAWREHGSLRSYSTDPGDPAFAKTGVVGSGQVWMAAIGPAVKRERAGAYTPGHCAHSEQIAASLLTALGEDWRAYEGPAPGKALAQPLDFIVNPAPLKDGER